MSTQHLVFNNLGSTLTNAITAGQTSFDVDDPVFTDPGTDFYTVTAENISTGSVEIMKVIGVTGSTLTVERGFEGTSPAAFDAGNPVQVRTTAGLINRLGQKSDLGVQYPFQTTVVTGLLNLYVDPAGSDATGDGSVGNPWATPYKAVEELQFIRFGVTGSAVVNFAAGTYSMDAQLVCNHPQGYRISFVSAAPFQRITGMPIADYSVDRNVPTVPGRGASDFYNTAGTVGVNASSGTRATNRANDWANNRLLFGTLIGCIFEWASAGADEPKFLINTHLGGISGIGLLFPTPTVDLEDNRSGIRLAPGATLQATDLQIYGGQVGLSINEGQVVCNFIAVSGSRIGVLVENAGVLSCEEIDIQGTDSHGVRTVSNSTLDTNSDLTVSGCGTHGVNLDDNSTWRVDTSTAISSGNQGNGVLLRNTASIVAGGSGGADIIATGNTNSGISAATNAVATLGDVDVIGNGADGISFATGATIRSFSGTHKANNNASDGVGGSENGHYGCVTLQAIGNGANGLYVRTGATLLTSSDTTIQNNAARAIELVYSGPIRLSGATIDTSNLATPHCRAVGKSICRMDGPGVGNVGVSVQFSPTYDTASVSGSIFNDES